MAFQSGRSGNPNGRPKGALSKRTQLVKLLEPHAEALVAKTMELALGGDVNALRLCIERLIPKIQHEPMDIEFPNELNQRSIRKLKDKILMAVFERKISIDDAEKLIKLIKSQSDGGSSSTSFPKLPNDPIEAARIYQQIMCS